MIRALVRVLLSNHCWFGFLSLLSGFALTGGIMCRGGAGFALSVFVGCCAGVDAGC